MEDGAATAGRPIKNGAISNSRSMNGLLTVLVCFSVPNTENMGKGIEWRLDLTDS
jgi:hypothetical protein